MNEIVYIYIVNYRQFPAVLEALWLQLHHHRTHSPCLVQITLFFFVCVENNKILLRKVIETFIPFYVFYLSIEMLFFVWKIKKNEPTNQQQQTEQWMLTFNYRCLAVVFYCLVTIKSSFYLIASFLILDATA